MARDDLELAATYYAVTNKPAPAVLLIHSLGKNREEWLLVPALFQMNGVAVLALDLRGHGESTRRLSATGIETVDYHNFQLQQYRDMLLDINLAYDWLAKQPGIDKQRIALVGSTFGANLALRYAAFNDEVAALLLLSPGFSYQGMRTDDVIVGLHKRPLRIVVSRDDAYAFESAKRMLDLRRLAGQAAESNELIACTGDLQGAAMLTGVKELSGVVFSWLDEVLQRAPVPVPPDDKPVPSPAKVERAHTRN